MHIESNVRPIAVTNTIAKIAEKFVNRYSNDFYDEYTDVNQFGCVCGRSITHVLLKLMHELFVAADCTQNIIKILFVDFSKAFDVIFDFLNSRKQFVKLVTLYLIQL